MISSSTPSVPSVALLPTIVEPETHELIKRGRVKDPAALASAYQTLFTADRESSRQRALVQAQVDGAPPYSDSQERVKGLHGRANVNWGLSDQGLSEAVAPFNDILDAIDSFGMVPTAFGDQNMRERFGIVISEEISRMIRNWDDFYDNWEQNALLFNQEGLSFIFFDDDRDWRWKVYGQQFFKFPRRVRANLNYTDIMVARVDMMPHELFAKVRNPKAAEEAGWHPKEVMEALKGAAPHGIPTNDPQEWQRAWKDNDIIYGVTSPTVETVQGWVRELDGTVSHYIGRADGGGGWLYCSEGKYRSMKRMIVAYKGNVGTNGDFQSIRGWGQKSFSSASAINRMICKMLDMAVHQATPVLTCDSEDALTDQAIQQWGPYLKMASGVTFAEQKMPNFDNSLVPAINTLQDIFRTRSSSYAPLPAAQMDRTQRTKFEVQTKNEQSGKLTSASMNRFFKAWGDHFKEIVRRACDPEYTQEDPGGQEVWEFRRRCIKRQVPLQAIFEVDIGSIEVNMGFGKGSASERRSAVAALEPNFYQYDQRGQKMFLNMKTAAYMGTTLANQLAPIGPDRVPSEQVHIAISENNEMSNGGQVMVLEDDDHAVHLNTHLTRLFEINDLLSSVQITLEEGIPQMMPIWQHAGEHLQYMDPQNPATKEFKEALQQLGEVVTNGQKELDADAAKAAKEQGIKEGAEGQGAYGDMSASTYKQAVQAQQSIQQLDLDAAKQQQQLDFDARKREQDLMFRDAGFAQEVRQKAAMMRLQLQEKAANVALTKQKKQPSPTR